jgi:hypothetical protein
MPGRWFAWLAVTGLVLAAHAPAVAGAPDIVVAQANNTQAGDTPSNRPRHRPPARITVYPSDRFYRDCNTRYEVQHRASGDVIYPQINCQWSVR